MFNRDFARVTVSWHGECRPPCERHNARGGKKPMKLVRFAAAGAVLAGGLLTASSAFAAGAPVLDHQLNGRLGPSQATAFQFNYGGQGDLAQIVVLPTGGAGSLSVQV